MAGKISSFVSSGLLVIRIGKAQYAYCQSVSFNQNVNVVPVGGIGSFSFNALEPTAIQCSGSMRVIRWDSRLWAKVKEQAGNTLNFKPDNMAADADSTFASRRGNSLLDGMAFNPVQLLLSATFDIEVYERGPKSVTKDPKSGLITAVDAELIKAGNPLFRMVDCRMTDYSFDFAPGQLLFENVNYVCAQVQEDFTE